MQPPRVPPTYRSTQDGAIIPPNFPDSPWLTNGCRNRWVKFNSHVAAIYAAHPFVQVTPELYPSRGSARHPLRFIIPGLKTAEELLATLDTMIHLLQEVINKEA